MMRILLVIVVMILLLSGVSVRRATLMPGVSAQDRLRIVIEEVQLPVAAFDKYGHRDPGLTIDDLLVLENGTPQDVKSVRQIPANVVLLLDTGGEVNPAENIRTSARLRRIL
jgi:predicted amino acid dehydrogenase